MLIVMGLQKEVSMYQIIINNEVVKTYPHRLQCVIWCYTHGRVVSSHGVHWLVNVEIRKVEK